MLLIDVLTFAGSLAVTCFVLAQTLVPAMPRIIEVLRSEFAVAQPQRRLVLARRTSGSVMVPARRSPVQVIRREAA